MTASGYSDLLKGRIEYVLPLLSELVSIINKHPNNDVPWTAPAKADILGNLTS